MDGCLSVLSCNGLVVWPDSLVWSGLWSSSFASLTIPSPNGPLQQATSPHLSVGNQKKAYNDNQHIALEKERGRVTTFLVAFS